MYHAVSELISSRLCLVSSEGDRRGGGGERGRGGGIGEVGNGRLKKSVQLEEKKKKQPMK